ncbi:MAG: hypothetical protein G01um101466_153 [Parcubacteria group bacterium Gr01-1014_66]|nr:MAG: hypothetical protein G01um101466_153 [Parcubacteria group bacterium Gr01-1014_66]
MDVIEEIRTHLGSRAGKTPITRVKREDFFKVPRAIQCSSQYKTSSPALLARHAPRISYFLSE